VPIVEPEVLMGGHHSVERCHEVTEMALNSLFTELYEQGVALEGVILKPNMVVQSFLCHKRQHRFAHRDQLAITAGEGRHSITLVATF